jgi:hypothetical protein
MIEGDLWGGGGKDRSLVALDSSYQLLQGGGRIST